MSRWRATILALLFRDRLRRSMVDSDKIGRYVDSSKTATVDSGEARLKGGSWWWRLHWRCRCRHRCRQYRYILWREG